VEQDGLNFFPGRPRKDVLCLLGSTFADRPKQPPLHGVLFTLRITMVGT
jgi:hypothetical protein